MFSRETQALMEAAVDAIVVIDDHGHILAVNDATTRIFGYRSEELLGQNVSKLMPEPERAAHDGHLARYLETGVARIIGIGREVRAQRKDGELFPMRLSVGRIQDSDPPRFVGLLRDVSGEHAAFEALQRERDRAHAFLELNDSILLEIDAARRVREINARGSELLGAAVPEILGRDWLDFIRGDAERERAKTMLASALVSSHSREREYDALDMSGEPRRVYWRCLARRAVNGDPAGWLCSGIDVTDRARREAQASLAQDRLTRVSRLATVGEMAAGVAHEINQPLTAITTYARACERYLDMPQPDFAELKEAVREIGSEGLRAGAIIHRLRKLARPDGGDERIVTDVNALLEELRPMLLADARMYDVRLSFTLAAALPQVLANGTQLQQVLLNLVRNACEALMEMPPGARTVEIATAHVANGEIEISVTDDGPGVADSVADTLFDQFTTTKEAGTGLGLAISRTVMQGHRGSIATRKAQPRGAVFYIRLPAVEESLA